MTFPASPLGPVAPGRRSGGRWVALAVVLVGGVVVWIVAGAPWWAPAALLAGGLAGRLVAVLVTARYRETLVQLGVLAALGWLVVQLDPAGWLAVAGLVVLAAVALGVPRRLLGVAGWDGRRMAGAAIAAVLLVAGATEALIEHDLEQRDRDADRCGPSYSLNWRRALWATRPVTNRTSRLVTTPVRRDCDSTHRTIEILCFHRNVIG